MIKVGIHHNAFIAIFFTLSFVGIVGCEKAQNKSSPDVVNEEISAIRLKDGRTNVVLITIDTLRSDRLRCYGYYKNISPAIDRLAREGILFSNTIAQASNTPVSHASILTGLYPYHHGLRYLHGGNQYELKDNVTTLAEILRENGYKTAAFISAFSLISRRYNLDQGFEWYDEEFLIDEGTENSPKGVINTGKSQRRADETNKKVFQWLEEHYKEKIFLWIHYFDPHDVFLIPPAEFLKRFPSFKSALVDKPIELYDVEIAYTDYQFGKLWQKFRALGIEENTLFVLTADHGQGLNDHGYWSHGEKLYQEQIHIPLIMKHSKLPHGKRIPALTRTVDIIPTVIDLLDLQLTTKWLDGISLMPYIIGNQPSINLMAYSETHYPKFLKNESPLFSLIDGKWKFIYHSEGEDKSQLFDLKNDSKESNNVAEIHPEIVKRFENHLRREKVFIKEDFVPKQESLDRDTVEKLKTLGYL